MNTPIRFNKAITNSMDHLRALTVGISDECMDAIFMMKCNKTFVIYADV